MGGAAKVPYKASPPSHYTNTFWGVNWEVHAQPATLMEIDLCNLGGYNSTASRGTRPEKPYHVLLLRGCRSFCPSIIALLLLIEDVWVLLSSPSNRSFSALRMKAEQNPTTLKNHPPAPKSITCTNRFKGKDIVPLCCCCCCCHITP